MEYYSERLNSERLRECYELAPARIKQFLEAEIIFVKERIQKSWSVLDLGCGYGRVAIRLLEKAKEVTGIDISEENIKLAKELFSNQALSFHTMNAISMDFPDSSFDATICVQNGISAFHVDPNELISESLRVTRKGGILLFSSYSENFWEERLKWFQWQSESGLIGEIDYHLTKEGTIVCKDGFKAITYSAQDFLKLAAAFHLNGKIYEIDDSCVFCEMVKN